MWHLVAWPLMTAVLLGVVYLVVRLAVVSGVRQVLREQNGPDRVPDGRNRPLKL